MIVTGSEEYNEKKEKNITHIRIADIMNDKVLYHLDMEGSYLLKDIYQNQIVIANFQLMELDFYDFELNKVSTLKVDDLAGYFYNNQYYYLDQSALFAMDIRTNRIQQIKVENDMRFASLVGIEDHYLICYPFVDRQFEKNCIALLDINDGSFVALNDKYIDLQIDDNLKVFKEYNEIKNGDYYTYTYNIKEKYYTTSDTPLSKKYLNYVPHTQYFYELQDVSEEEMSNDQPNMKIYHMDQNITVCNLSDYEYKGEINDLTYLEEENLMIGYNQSLVIIDPTYLKFKQCCHAKTIEVELKNQNIIEKYNQKIKTTVQGLKRAKSKIKQLKDTYHVDIFISTDCQKNYLQDSGFTFQDTSHYKDEEERILEALGKLEKGLELYPQHFFKQFYTKAGDGGVKIYLVGEIESTYSVIAFEFESAYNQNIVLDINNYELQQTFCHELWHAMENIAISKNSTIFDDWNQLNPKGFEYTEEYEGYDEKEDLDHYNFFFNEDDIQNVYFIDDYSHTYGKEDRARIVEYFMTVDKETKKRLQKSPHLLKKVEKINDIIEKTFEISFKI